MTQPAGRHSSTGVWVVDDFRDNLIIDRYDPVFDSMRAKKLQHLRSSNSEDAVTWNVFRSLRQIDSCAWLPPLAAQAFPAAPVRPAPPAAVVLWQTIKPPPSLFLSGDEGPSEIDVILESPEWVWFLEAKYQSDISVATTVRSDRDQILRNIDVGSYYAGARDFYFSLLVQSVESSPRGASLIREYADIGEPRRRLADHRPDGIANLRAVSLLTWSTLGRVLAAAVADTQRGDEKVFAERALAWLQDKGLA